MTRILGSGLTRRSVILSAAALPAFRSGAAEAPLIAVASNFAPLALYLGFRFRESHDGAAPRFVLGSSGKFYAQIRAGAPFEALLSADQEIPAKLEAEGFAEPGSRFTYATGRLVLMVDDQSRLHDEPEAILRDPSVAHVAIAQPDVAPYGVAALAALETLGLADEMREKLVIAQNVAQAFAMVSGGAAQAGFVALSAAIASPESEYIILPETLHKPIRQDAVLLTGASGFTRAFLEWLKGDEAAEVMETFGYKAR